MPASTLKPCTLQDIRHVALSYDSANSEKSALQICLTLFPDWGTSEGEISFIPFKDGITNTLLKAVKKRQRTSLGQAGEEAVLIRAFGNRTEILIDRQRELTAHLLLAQHGLAPPLFARFENGLVYRYVDGDPCTPEMLRQEPIWRAVARKLAQWHALLPIGSMKSAAVVKDDVEVSLGSSPPVAAAPKAMIHSITPNLPAPNIWTVMAKWILVLPTDSPAALERRDRLQKEVRRTISELASSQGPGQSGLVFAHCDLLSGNVIVEPRVKKNSTENGFCAQTVNFIDYEYATPGPAAFDLANHFAEWAGFDCEYGAIPTRSTRRHFIEEYISSFAKHGDLGEGSEALHVKQLVDEVDRFRGIPGLFWGIWGLIQATISEIDFDYATYADTRLQEYWDWRAEQDAKREARELASDSLRERRWAEP